MDCTIAVLLQIHSDIWIPKIIRIEHGLTHLLQNYNGAIIFASQCIDMHHEISMFEIFIDFVKFKKNSKLCFKFSMNY